MLAHILFSMRRTLLSISLVKTANRMHYSTIDWKKQEKNYKVVIFTLFFVSDIENLIAKSPQNTE